MGFMDFMFGRKGEMMQTPTMTGGQSDLLSQLLGALQGGGGGMFGQGGQYLSQMLSGSPEAMQAFQAPAMRQFQQSTIPGLAERFSGMGSGSQSSSAFGQQMGAAGAGLSENLAAMRGQLQQGALSQMMGMGQMGLGARQFENVYRPAEQGFMQAMAPGICSALGMAATGGFGGFGGISDLLKKFMPQSSTGQNAWQPGHYGNDEVYYRR